MLLHRRIILCGRSIGALALFVVSSSACGDDVAVVTHSEAGSGTSGTEVTTGTSGIPTTGSVTTGSTGGECVLPQKQCNEVANCYEGEEARACPGSSYPCNWSCVSGFCEHGGCGADSDCTNILPGFECHTVNGTGQCVAPCGSNADCSELFMSDLQCTVVSSKGNFCQ